MRTRMTVAASIATVAVAMLIPAAPSGADENILGECPDGYTPTLLIAAPEEDRNGNGVICVKFVGSHDNTHDDPKGKKYKCNGVAPPPECQGDPEGTLYVLDDITD